MIASRQIAQIVFSAFYCLIICHLVLPGFVIPAVRAQTQFNRDISMGGLFSSVDQTQSQTSTGNTQQVVVTNQQTDQQQNAQFVSLDQIQQQQQGNQVASQSSDSFQQIGPTFLATSGTGSVIPVQQTSSQTTTPSQPAGNSGTTDSSFWLGLSAQDCSCVFAVETKVCCDGVEYDSHCLAMCGLGLSSLDEVPQKCDLNPCKHDQPIEISLVLPPPTPSSSIVDDFFAFVAQPYDSNDDNAAESIFTSQPSNPPPGECCRP
eukprot:TRINITY_DN18244_c0_g2_i4.p2 TRINITY_DN18244_c0_g2~~TRINITY_DN18244_c0_g2_i4.p2  ORF type:complete len:262 (-),score=17.75 TRINITY_DN18244_c0_g2_i4:500-1285(-)